MPITIGRKFFGSAIPIWTWWWFVQVALFREEKSLRHVSMVAKFLDNNEPKIYFKSGFALFQPNPSYSTSFNLSNVGEMFWDWILNILETQGQIVGKRESLNGRKNKPRRKVKNGQKSPWGQSLTRPVPNGRCRSGFWLVPEKHKFSGTNQKPERRRPFGTGLVRHCP